MSNQNTVSNNVDNVDNHEDEDINIEQDGGHHRISTSTSTTFNTNTATSSGLEVIEDDNSNMPLPTGMAEVISNRAEPPKETGKIEQIDDNDLGPEPPVAMLETSLNAADPEIASKVTADIVNNLASINEEQNNPPVPFNSADYEDTIAKKIAIDVTNQTPSVINTISVEVADEESMYEPPREIIEGEEGMIDNTNTGRGGTNRRGWDDIEAQQRRRAQDIDDDGEVTEAVATEDINNEVDDAAVDEDTVQLDGHQLDQSAIHIPEAFLVEDIEEEVFIATPTLPWWKQRRTKIFFGIMFILVATLSIVLGIELSKDDGPDTVVNMIINSTSTPSVSLAPSSSQAPSSSPTECVNKIISNKQEIDLIKDLQIDDPRDAKLAVDGRNMVVVAVDGKYYTEDDFGSVVYTGPTYIIFYLLDDGEWQRVQSPLRVDDMGKNSLVAMSGNTALVGFPGANDNTGAVLVYEQNQFGEWERVNDPFIHAVNTTQVLFGRYIDIDEDLACVGDIDNVKLYHLDDDEGKWVQFDTIQSGQQCSVSGDSIIVRTWAYDIEDRSIQIYKYNQDQNEVVSIQGSIPARKIRSLYLSNDYLVYRDIDFDRYDSDVFIYHRNETSQPFTLIQQLNITGPGDNHQLALDNDMLVVRSEITHIYSLQDGNWEETVITLDDSYDDYQLSGRTLLVTKNNETMASEIYAYNIEDCTQNMPTQSPTLFSLSPSMSSLPTTKFECFNADDGGKDGVLYDAVRSYVDQDCAVDKVCEIAQTYGWPMNSWCVGNVKDMSYLFDGMSGEDINGWNTSSVTDMSYMFRFASYFNRDISDWNTSSVTTMNGMFQLALSFNGDVSNFDTSRVTDMSYMFAYASSFNGDVSNFDTSSVTNMTGMFWGASSFNRDVSSFDTSSVTDMYAMFHGATASISWMYNDTSSFNRDVSNFDTSSVTNMGYMFSNAKAFNGDVSNFDTSRVTDMSFMFSEASSFNGDVSNFDTSNVTSMEGMFRSATSFDQDISSFDFSSVTEMQYMFRYATSFNRDVSNFDTSSVTDMGYMFSGASSYNQDLCAWRDSFPYTNATDTFLHSGCTYQDTPIETQQGPFCASDCGAPSMSPTSSSAPTTSLKPTQSPTVSSSPTDTCYWVDIVVVFDDYPEETSWQLETINDSGEKNVLKTFNGSSDDNSKARKDSMCLEGEREYQFTIYDSEEDGIFSPGHYNVTSNGSLIVQGGYFNNSESIVFSIPYVITQAQSMSPTSSLAPTTSQQTDHTPVTPFPTEAESSPPQESSVLITTPPPYVRPNVKSPPIASPDSASVSTGDEVFVSVLDNDTPTTGKTLEVESITSQASNGNCSISPDSREVIYIPNPGFTGFDSCVYEICDSVPACDTAILTVVVTGTRDVSQQEVEEV